MDDNVTSLDAHKIANLIVQNHLDKFSDNGAVYRASRDELLALKESVSEDVWAEAVTIAHRRWGQQ
jgi:hypothetical protein